MTTPATAVQSGGGPTRSYGTGDAAPVTALDGVTVDFARGHLHRRDGPVRLGQVHAAALRRRPRPADRGQVVIGGTDLGRPARDAR